LPLAVGGKKIETMPNEEKSGNPKGKGKGEEMPIGYEDIFLVIKAREKAQPGGTLTMEYQVIDFAEEGGGIGSC